jgi:hypothetical protein
MKWIGAAMTTQYYTGPNYGGRFLGFLLALVLGASAFAVFVRHSTTGRAGRMVALITGRGASHELSEPAVVVKMQRLGHMPTAVYSLDTVVADGLSAGTASGAPGGERILLVVHGASVAGIDMAQLKPEDVRIDASTHSIHVTLPPAQLFSTKLDDQRTRLVERSSGLLVPMGQALGPVNRVRAQDQMQQTALADGILDAARANARASVSALLSSLGFEQVDVK